MRLYRPTLVRILICDRLGIKSLLPFHPSLIPPLLQLGFPRRVATLETQMAPQVKGWQMSKHRRRSRFFWSGLEAQRREQSGDIIEQEPQPQPWWVGMDQGIISFDFLTQISYRHWNFKNLSFIP